MLSQCLDSVKDVLRVVEEIEENVAVFVPVLVKFRFSSYFNTLFYKTK